MTVPDREQTERFSDLDRQVAADPRHPCATTMRRCISLVAQLAEAQDRLRAQGEYQTLSEQQERELRTLRAQLAERERALREAGERVCGLLRDTFYRPPGFSGPDPWWKDRSEAAIAEFDSVAATHSDNEEDRF